MARRVTRPWTPKEEAELLLRITMTKRGACVGHAAAHGRSERSVRMKLHHLLKDPANRPPDFKAALASYRAASPATDAAAPRVSLACGPTGTTDKSD
jgi:hypothetical protein